MRITDLYTYIALKMGINESYDKTVGKAIREILVNFCQKYKNPAIWCNGQHTRMLMANYIFELKKVKYIIDSNADQMMDGGFKIITPDRIDSENIDAVIISTYKYRNEIKNEISAEFPKLIYLDIYDELSKQGIKLTSGYYSVSFPYVRYKELNRLQRQISGCDEIKQQIEIYKNIAKQYFLIKNIPATINIYYRLVDIDQDNTNKEILRLLIELRNKIKSSIRSISENNTVMICLDGLRRRDVLESKTPKIKKWLDEHTHFFINAYSVSTSTYESLIPVYSNNNDLRTKYFDKDYVDEADCVFICKAEEQCRNIYFYGDGSTYISGDDIKRENNPQTITEKLWDFINDATIETNGLFYIHILYETHYSYPNPYTKEEIVADGTNIMFDYLENKGGKLRTNYVRQQADSLRYVDDVMGDFLENIKCKIVLFADHGNILLEQSEKPDKIEADKYSYADELLEIPIAIYSHNQNIGEDSRLVSQMELSRMICDLLDDKKYDVPTVKYVKSQRSEIYTPDFRYLYKKYGKERELLAFERFTFDDGTFIVIYSNGEMTGETALHDKLSENDIYKYYNMVKKDVTVINV